MPARGAAACALLAGLAAAAPQGGKFPVATTVGLESSVGMASDGVNFLVGLNGDATGAGAVGAQLVSGSGSLIGPLVSTGRQGSAPVVGYGGGRYLLVWGDTAVYPNRQVYGQLVDGSGGAVGGPFPISENWAFFDRAGVAFDGQRFLVTYYWEVDPANDLSFVCAKFVTPAGVVGPRLVISSGFGHQGLNNVAFDGSNYLVVWCDDVNDTDVIGRRINTAGVVQGSEIPIDVDTERSDNPLTVAFDGANYLVLWTDEIVGGRGWDVYGQLLTPAGALQGGVIAVCEADGHQLLPMVATDGATWFATWTDMRNDANGNSQCDALEGTCLDVYGRQIGPVGTWMGEEWPMVVQAGDQFASPIARGGASYLLAWCDGTLNPNPPSGGDVHGVLLPTAGFPQTYCTAKLNSQGCAPFVAFAGIPGVSDPDPFEVGAVQVINNKNGILFYGLAPNNLPFQGGFLCVQPPIKRTPVQSSGGNPPPNDCSGTFSFNFNAQIQGGADPGLVPGTSVYDQYWYRDPQSPSTTGLTDAVGFDILP